MLKRLFAFAAVFIFLIAALPAFAGELFDAQTAIDDAVNNNSEFYVLSTKDGDDLNYVSIPILSNYLKGDSYYGCLVYGQPHGDVKDGQYRYLGYTLFKDPASGTKENYTNVAFPPDVAHSGYLEDQQWIYRPWRNDDVKNNYTIDFNNGIDGTDRYAQNIRQGILVYYTDPDNANNYQVRGINADTQEFWDNIHQYVHVLAPPTKWAWGIGRMWRYGSGGQINYMTVPLLPDALLPEPGNLKAVSIDLGVPQGQKAEAGAEYTATVVFENESDQAYPGTPIAVLHGQYQATLYDENGQVLPKKVVGGKEVQVADFGKKGEPNARRAFTCKWHPFGQSRDGLTGIINRDEIGKAHLETTYEDNTVKAGIPVELVNLKVTDITLTPDPGEPGQLASGTITVLNESEKSFTNVKTVWRVRRSDGTVLDEGTIVTDRLAAGESKQLPFSFTPDRGDTYSVAAMVNPDGDWPPNEINFLSGDWPGDNRMEVSYCAEEPCTDISVTAGIYPLSVQSGGTVTVTAFVERANDGPGRAVPVNVTISSDYGSSKTGTLYLDRGESGSFNAKYTLSGEGDVVFTVEAWPDGTEDCRPGNNKDSISAIVDEPIDIDPTKDDIWVHLIS
ncbi:MAG TPA: hypothetical protein PK728_04835 [Bacillota bacterium]|nr:hypothetical protein [Bacillota bacterium]